MRVYVTNGPRVQEEPFTPRAGTSSYPEFTRRKVGPCPGSRRRWVLGSVHACSEAVHAANTYCPKFQVRTRPTVLGFRLGPDLPREAVEARPL